MARILWHGIGPWHKTAYGQQTALFAPRLAALGHEVALAVMGRKGIDDDPAKAHPDAARALRARQWEGLALCGPGKAEFGLPSPAEVRGVFGGHEPDLVLVLKDAWVLHAPQYHRYRTAVWCNIDCEPMGKLDRLFFEVSGARPIAVSKFGLSMMRGAGLKDALYVPHGIDLAVWGWPADRAALRAELGLPERAFIAGINATNAGTVSRKAWYEQMAAFARAFHGKLADQMLLLCHTAPVNPEGIDLRAVASHLGIAEVVKFGSHVNMKPGQLLTWYQCLDVLMAATYGEGFGVPILEAQACGVPVIGTECTAISEKIPAGTGWLVYGQPWWNAHHEACWTIPNIPRMAAMLGRASAQAPPVPREHVAKYGADYVTREHWKPVLDQLLQDTATSAGSTHDRA